jgi:tRNA pseudouridine55 synthase
LNGVINLFKEKNFTSFQAAAAVRRLFGVKKCGHTGTLDPMAEGVLPVCIGFATRFADYLSVDVKEYYAEFLLGRSFDTFDITGKVAAQSETKPSYAEIEDILNSFAGEHAFTVPAYSAKKIDGKRAYALAREGKLTDAGEAMMKVYNIKLLGYRYPAGSFSIRCAKGTYIRSIINALGKQSGAEAAMSALMRTENGVFTLASSYKISDLERLKDEGRLQDALTPLNDILPLKKAVVSGAAVTDISHGRAPRDYLEIPALIPGEEYLILDDTARIIALAVNSTPAGVKKVFI